MILDITKSIWIFFFCLVSCNMVDAKDSIAKTKLEYDVISENRISIEYSDSKTLEIITNSGISHLNYKGSKVKLPQEITSFNLSSIFKSHLNGIGNVVILEYYILGASGLSANITFTSLIKISENNIVHKMDFSSFSINEETLFLENDILHLDIYKLFRNDSLKEEYYCKTKFRYNNTFEPVNDSQSCFQFDNGVFLEKSNCDCEILKTPQVMNR